MKRISLPLFLLLILAPAEAAAIKGCFERVYDIKHLEANPSQFVDSVQVNWAWCPRTVRRTPRKTKISWP
jgi:hypothetical protein